MKKLILLSLLVFVLIVNSALVEAATGIGLAQFKVQKLRYEPYPANPGEYFDLWVKVKNVGGGAASNAIFELVLEYPFSLHPDIRPIQKYGVIGTSDDDIIVLEYKIKVDEDAVEGTYKLTLKTCAENIGNCVFNDFNVTVENVRTDFEVVVQESTAEVVSLAIANTGKNPANSVTVKIPEQENFRAVGVAESIIGNINSGDYTIASFQIQSKTVGMSQGGTVSEAQEGTLSEEERQKLRESFTARKTAGTNLEVQIDYTDIISTRRTVMKNVSLSLESALSEVGGITPSANFRGMGGGLATNVWFWVSVVLLVIIGAVIYRLVKTKKLYSLVKTKK